MNNTPREVPVLADPLGEVLHQLRLNGSLYCRSELTKPWSIEMPVLEASMMFHIVTSGQCWIQVGLAEPSLLRKGSLALIPHGKGHVISSSLDSNKVGLFDLEVEKISERYEVLRYGGGGELTQLTCGVVSFDHVAGQKLINQLPELLVIDSWDMDRESWLESTLRFIAQEARELKPGGVTVLTHLADIIIIQAIRTWLDRAPEANTGWLAALRDKQIGASLAAIHREPGKNWTVESLASEVGMSRSGFSARFTELIGDSAKSYLTHWRMQLAKARLLEQSVPLGILSEELGYNSEAAFCRAFKRIIGVSPGGIQETIIKKR